MKTINELVEQITKGERFISQQQLEQLEDLNGIWIENCGTSGTNEGILFTLYTTDEYGNKTDEEICEVVFVY